jgi:large subunit ribosomal protein L13
MKTHTVLKKNIERKWYLVDANDIRLGKLASVVASLLIGKGKVAFTKNLNVGDCVVVLNAEKISVSANKKETKTYFKHSGYVGNYKVETLGNLLERKPEEVIIKAVSGMLPKNKLRSEYLKNLHVYAGDKHKYEAQKPVKIEIK